MHPFGSAAFLAILGLWASTARAQGVQGSTDLPSRAAPSEAATLISFDVGKPLLGGKPLPGDAFYRLVGRPDLAERYSRRQGRKSTVVARQRKGLEAQGKALAKLDPKGGNSNITTDHHMSLQLLANDYPAALVGALSGDEKPLADARAELDKRQKKVESWLAEVKKAKK